MQAFRREVSLECLRVGDPAAAQFHGDVAVASAWPVGGQSSAVFQTTTGHVWKGSQKLLEGRAQV